MSPTKTSFVYILANKRNGTIYTGVTSDLIKRVHQHKSKYVKGFTERYNLTNLVYFEIHECISLAIKREKNIKAWKRKWKLTLIESQNPCQRDLYPDIAA